MEGKNLVKNVCLRNFIINDEDGGKKAGRKGGAYLEEGRKI